MHHLTIRVAWHDKKWNGTICSAPKDNAFCLALDRVRIARNDDAEDALKNKLWAELKSEEMPPCIAESGGFMSPIEWRRRFIHPYQDIAKAAKTHGVLKPTTHPVPPYSTFAVPFFWMLNQNQSALDSSLAQPLPPDNNVPFQSSWVFSNSRQEAICNLVFGRLKDEKSLAFFYCKEGQPMGDEFARLVVGVGRITKVGPVLRYESTTEDTYPMWDRLIRHSIRPSGYDGFLLPYHEYSEPTGNREEDERRQRLLREIAIPVEGSNVRAFSYGAELATSDIALSILVQCLESVRKIREHKIVDGPWAEREDWLNQQIALTWKDRGAFPGLGSALEAIGLRLGTALFLELLSSEAIKPDDDPWPIVDEILRGKRKPPQPVYIADLKAVQATWEGLTDERRTLLVLLSRFSLTSDQAKRWFQPRLRAQSSEATVTDAEIIQNPYRIAETDLGDGTEPPISVGVIDRGLLPNDVVTLKNPLPEPSRVGSPSDPRRIRAALVILLRDAADSGDSLLSVVEALERAAKLDLAPRFSVELDWINANRTFLADVIELVDVVIKPGEDSVVQSVQLLSLFKREDRLRRILQSRAEQAVPVVKADWQSLLVDAIREAGGHFDPKNDRHKAALVEQADALSRITSRKLGVLVGRAGTGKSSTLGAIMKSSQIASAGILLLAPTGKARVRLGKATNAEAKTVAQFLNDLGRYDGKRQRPLFAGDKYRKEKTIVIDECSMLTMDDMFALLEALDQIHVDRIILVGDPNQLPPIGVGRPFADLIAMLEDASGSNEPKVLARTGALGRLTVEVRTSVGGPSDALRLASWYTREQQPVDADRVLSDLELNNTFNDLEVTFWKTPDELHARLLEQFQKHLGLANGSDVKGFNKALGLDDKGFVPEFDAKNAEHFQILSPVRMHAHGVHEINRWVQRRFRSEDVARSREPWGMSLGDEEIVLHDKVINVRNKIRGAFNGKPGELYLANGEIGLVCGRKSPFMNVAIAGRPGWTVGYRKSEFPKGSGPLELAYALTVHKAQGSEFSKVFVVLPKGCFLLSRELLYTALTRSRDRLVLLIEGDNASELFEFTKPEKSDTARRNTNLFRGAVREQTEAVPYAEHLIHRTDKGHLVRSKSELVIANKLFAIGISYDYERRLERDTDRHILRPDFTFSDPAGNPIIWEHLGMLGRDDYRMGWEWKLDWYKKNGFEVGENLFTTEDDLKGGLDSSKITEVAKKIQQLI